MRGRIGKFREPICDSAVREVIAANPAGIKEFTVCGIYRDFARDRGTILMPRTLFERYEEKQVHSLALKLRDPELANTVVEAFRERRPTGSIRRLR